MEKAEQVLLDESSSLREEAEKGKRTSSPSLTRKGRRNKKASDETSSVGIKMCQPGFSGL